MILVASFCLSLSALAFEVLLARIFAFSQWNHLSFMVISIALFGFAASGTLLSILDFKNIDWRGHAVKPAVVAVTCLLFALSLAGGIQLYNLIPLDYFKITLQPIQGLYLLGAYLILAAPFLFTGTVITAAFAVMPGKSGLVYFTTMAGSACGAALPWLSLPRFDLGWLILGLALLPLAVVGTHWALTLLGESRQFRANTKKPTGAMVLIGTIALAPVGLQYAHPLQFRTSEYKAVHQTLKYPDTRVIRSTHRMHGRFDTVSGPYVRYAPGLSLAHTDPLPNPTVVFKDGDRPLHLFPLDRGSATGFARSTLTFSGYVLAPLPQSAMIVQLGGGLAVPCALAAGIDRIRVATPASETAKAIGTHYGLPAAAGPIRKRLLQTEATYDVVQVENWGPSLPGTAVLTQDHTLTVDALAVYWRRLSRHGRIVISRRLLLPPADMVRLWANAYEGMRRMGVARPDEHIAVLRNWDTYTMIISKNPLSRAPALVDHAARHYFDIVFLPEETPEWVNRFAVLDTAYYADVLKKLSTSYRNGREADFFRNYPMDVAPQTDDRPFPHRFVKWRHADKLLTGPGNQPYTLLLSGEAVVLVVLFEALLCAVAMLIVPATIYRRQVPRTSRTHGLFFLGVGAGFILTELFLIKAFILVFGDPVVSLMIVLATLLTFTAVGSFMSRRLTADRLTAVIIVLIIGLAAMLATKSMWTAWMLVRPQWLSFALALMVVAPTGVLLGIPFPLGMRTLVRSPAGIAYAWAANGIASVTASILAAQIAISLGVSAVMTAAIAAYGLAFINVVGTNPEQGGSD